MFTTTKATGHVSASGPVEFTPTLREGAEQPAALRVSMSIDISLEDAAGALWILVTEGTELSELDEDQFVHEMVLETLFAEGGNRVAAAREDMNEQEPGTFEAHTAHALRSIVARLYGTGPQSTARQCRTGGLEVAR